MGHLKIVQMGPLIPEIDLSKVQRTANKAQKTFHFSIGDKIETIGPSDVDGQYDFGRLEKLLKENRGESGVDIIIGVIDVGIYDELYSGIDENCKCIIISLYDIKATLERSRKSYVDYVLCEIAAQLLAIQYRRAMKISVAPEDCEEPWHDETRSCLFDYDENRYHTFKKLMSPTLCAKCKALFTEANVSERIQSDCVKIVKSGIRPIRTTLLETINNKFVWGLVGIFLGILLNQESAPPISYVFIGMIVLIIVVFIRYYKNQFVKL